MQNDRFNELLEGPLGHPIIMMRLNRLALALHYVVQQCGEAGDKALEEVCEDYRRRDEGGMGEPAEAGIADD